VEYEGILAISTQFVSITENLGGIKPQKITEKFEQIFVRILPVLRPHRNDLAHSFAHAEKENEIRWKVIWAVMGQQFPLLTEEIDKAVSELQMWDVEIPRFELTTPKSSIKLSQNFKRRMLKFRVSNSPLKRRWSAPLMWKDLLMLWITQGVTD